MSQQLQLMQGWIAVAHRFRRIRWPNMIHGMSRSDFFVMNLLFHHRRHHPEIPGIYASAIAERAQVSRAAISRQLQQLEDRGWIVRHTDPDRKRNVFVDLTEEGMEAIRQQHEYGEQFAHRVFSRIGEQRMEEAMQILNELASAMEEEIQQFADSSQETQAKGECK